MRLWISILVLATGLVGCNETSDSGASDTAGDRSGSQAVDVSPKELAGLLETEGNFVVIDIRTPAEFAEGHIDGAINIDFQAEDFADAIGKIDTSMPTVFHCRSGGRSGQALPVLEAMPFESLYHLSSGSMGWGDAGYPLVK